MQMLGMMALGVFVGAVVTDAIRRREDTGVASILGVISAALSGVVLAFMKFAGVTDQDALMCYPIGLVLGMMWAYSDVAAENVRKGHVIGWLHLIGTVGVTALAVIVVLIPYLRSAFH